MINNKKISDAMQNLVGFQSSNDPVASNLFVNNVHELINVKNLEHLLINYDKGIEVYDTLITYLKDDFCIIYDKYYKAKESNTNEIPFDGKFWDGSALSGQIIFFNQKTYSVINDTQKDPLTAPSNFSEQLTSWIAVSHVKSLSDELRSVIRGASKDLINDIITNKAVKRETKPLLETFVLFTTVGHLTNVEINQGRRVGFAINTKDTRGLLIALKSLRTQFDGVVDFDIQIHTPNSLTPIFTIPVNHTKISSFEITNLSEQILLGIDSDNNNISGSDVFFISYLENTIPISVRAIKRQLKFLNSNTSCGSCSQDVKKWQRASNFFNVMPFYVPSAKIPTINANFWDVGDMVFVEDTNFGLNFSCSVVCDETTVFLENLQEFAPALQWHTAYKIIEKFGVSTRVSGMGDEIKASTKNKAQFDTNSEKSQWLINYNNIRQGLRETFKNLDFPCYTPPSGYSLRKKVL